MEFTANVLTIKGFEGSADVHFPQVVMSDGALQWAGTHMFNKEEALKVAEAKAKSYNEA